MIPIKYTDEATDVMQMDDDSGGKSKKREPFKRKHRIKTSTSNEKEPAEQQAQTSITITVTKDQELQEKRRESVDQNNIKDGPIIVEPKEGGEGENAEQKLEEVNEDQGEKEPEKPKEVAPKETESKGPLIVPEAAVPPSKSGTTPRKAPKFKQRATRQFKSKPPKKGVLGFGDDIPGMDGLGTDITVICPWEAFSHLELHELAQFGII
ncbi:uncharacterized protein LOC130284073 isoform X2 [Hyla sarda]|uniref:uncharacterized protein LOC130284073 isoform X2 n=1 Tax=Hyla sarda TaxID=327740 RepID=UPI0024C43277|nr:uncharacterized protein LOC130284073 isoform X2 [Hyla sarda]